MSRRAGQMGVAEFDGRPQRARQEESHVQPSITTMSYDRAVYRYRATVLSTSKTLPTGKWFAGGRVKWAGGQPLARATGRLGLSLVPGL